jgi:1-acyl-sn-glycerol-3-phosphate acyltransferase
MKREAIVRRFWYAARALWWKTYWGMQVTGLENVPRSGPMLLCANHTSHLDAPALLAAMPLEVSMRTYTAAARDVFHGHPIRGFVGRLTTNLVPIERFAGFSRGLRELEAVLGAGHPLILFPEGRRSSSGRLLKLSDGAAMLSVRTGAPIVPVRLEGLLGALRPGAVWPSPTRVRVSFGRPILPGRPDHASRRDAYCAITARLGEALSQKSLPCLAQPSVLLPLHQ